MPVHRALPCRNERAKPGHLAMAPRWPPKWGPDNGSNLFELLKKYRPIRSIFGLANLGLSGTPHTAEEPSYF